MHFVMRGAIMRQHHQRVFVLVSAQPLHMRRERLPLRLVVVEHSDLAADKLRNPDHGIVTSSVRFGVSIISMSTSRPLSLRFMLCPRLSSVLHRRRLLGMPRGIPAGRGAAGARGMPRRGAVGAKVVVESDLAALHHLHDAPELDLDVPGRHLTQAPLSSFGRSISESLPRCGLPAGGRTMSRQAISTSRPSLAMSTICSLRSGWSASVPEPFAIPSLCA